jgi:hypothetical protein
MNKRLTVSRMFVALLATAFAAQAMSGPSCPPPLVCETDFESPNVYNDGCCEMNYTGSYPPIPDQCVLIQYRNVHCEGDPGNVIRKKRILTWGHIPSSCIGLECI